MVKKFLVDQKRVEKSREELRAIGGKDLSLLTPDGDEINGMYIHALDFKEIIDKYFDITTSQNTNGAYEKTFFIKSEYYLIKRPHVGEHLDLFNDEAKAIIKHLESLGITFAYRKTPSDIAKPSFVLGDILPSVENSSESPTSHPTVIIPAAKPTYAFYKDLALMYAFRGINVMMVDFRGYGKSKGSPSETKVKLDLETAYQYIREVEKIDNDQIIVHGHCLAGAVASDLAARHKGINLVLDRSFAEHRKLIGPVMADSFTKPVLKKIVLKISKIVKKIMPAIVNFNTAANLEKVTGNVIIVKSTRDELVTEKQTQKLEEAMPQSANNRSIQFDGDHNSSWNDSRETCRAFDEFLKDTHLIHKLF